MSKFATAEALNGPFVEKAMHGLVTYSMTHVAPWQFVMIIVIRYKHGIISFLISIII